MAGLTPAHLLIILVIALIVIGPGKLPEVGAAIGKSLREFQKASSGVQYSVTSAVTGAVQSIPATPLDQPAYPAHLTHPGALQPPAAPLPYQAGALLDQASAEARPAVYQQPDYQQTAPATILTPPPAT